MCTHQVRNSQEWFERCCNKCGHYIPSSEHVVEGFCEVVGRAVKSENFCYDFCSCPSLIQRVFLEKDAATP